MENKENEINAAAVPKQLIATVRLRQYGNTDYYNIDVPDAKTGDWVIVGAERGIDCGRIMALEEMENIQLLEYQRGSARRRIWP